MFMSMPGISGWGVRSSTSTPANSGKRMGALATACNLGQFSCTLLSGSVLTLGGTHSTVFVVAGVIAFVGALVTVFTRRLWEK
jgi:predicted MFS family arabinose efflux permease